MLGQIKTNGRGGELAGIQQLLEILDLKGALITIESGCGYWNVIENAKGRRDKREVWTSGDLDWLPQLKDWSGLKSIIAVRRTTLNGANLTKSH